LSGQNFCKAGSAQRDAISGAAALGPHQEKRAIDQHEALTRFHPHLLLVSTQYAQNPLRVKPKFLKPLKLIWAVQTATEKHLAWLEAQISR